MTQQVRGARLRSSWTDRARSHRRPFVIFSRKRLRRSYRSRRASPLLRTESERSWRYLSPWWCGKRDVSGMPGEDEKDQHKIDTVPPPATGDAYSAPTVVQQAPTEILEALMAARARRAAAAEKEKEKEK